MASTIRSAVLDAVKSSSRCMFAEDIAQVVGLKLGSIQAAASELVNEGLMKAKRKDRQDGRLQCVFYIRDEQLKGVANLHDYVRAKHAKKRKAKSRVSTDALLVLPISGDNDVSSITVTMDSARALYETLRKLFGEVR